MTRRGSRETSGTSRPDATDSSSPANQVAGSPASRSRLPEEDGRIEPSGPPPLPGVVAHAVFPCSLCHETAATVWVAPRGTPQPGPSTAADRQASALYARLGVEAGPLSVTIGGEVVDHA